MLTSPDSSKSMVGANARSNAPWPRQDNSGTVSFLEFLLGLAKLTAGTEEDFVAAHMLCDFTRFCAIVHACACWNV